MNYSVNYVCTIYYTSKLVIQTRTVYVITDYSMLKRDYRFLGEIYASIGVSC